MVEEIKFDGGDFRDGVIEILDSSSCDRCGGVDLVVLFMDGSENEYQGGTLCKPCIDAMFNSYHHSPKE